jgi:hypothetical protein
MDGGRREDAHHVAACRTEHDDGHQRERERENGGRKTPGFESCLHCLNLQLGLKFGMP